MRTVTPLVDDLFLDGKFIKITRQPKLDFLKFSSASYPFYSLLNQRGCSKTIKRLALLEPIDVRTYKRLGRFGTVYKGVNGYIYTHYGSNLIDVVDLQFLKDFIHLSEKVPNSINIKRIDFAFDLFGIDLIELIKSSVVHSKRQLTIQFLSYDPITGARIYKGDPRFYENIQTFYAGKVNSSTSVCIYKRHKKLNVSGPISRIEIRFKGIKADNVLNEFCLNDTPLEFNRILSNFFDYYLAFKLPNSSKSNRLSRYKNMPWWDDILAYLRL